ncbi:hypothetical protein WI41_03110 [Burkholderia latens]|uniref:Uncharacterized protein n=1 Tax=Burkholderia latens TaxID=488446 RepID=A0AAP1C5I4_9BURK|nr:hypothetical protein WI41_03110 [Burkholderia latens]
MPNRDRFRYPEIRTANPEFRIGRVHRRICARDAVAKDTFGSAPCGHADACTAVAGNAFRPARQASPGGISAEVDMGRARCVWRERDGKGRVI